MEIKMYCYRGRTGMFYVRYGDAATRMLLPHDPFGPGPVGFIRLTFGTVGTQDQLDTLRESLKREVATIH